MTCKGKPVTKFKAISAVFFIVLAFATAPGKALAQEHDESGSEHESSSNAFKFNTMRTWFFRSFLPNVDDDANTLGLEFVSSWGWGNYDVVNISYIELADYPVGIPGLPPGNPEPTQVADTGINDLLSAFLFSKKGARRSKKGGEAVQVVTL